MNKKAKKTLLVILLSIVCALMIVGAVVTIQDFVDENIDSVDDGWTGNY
ncbi:MAG: hypothetical protein J6A63_08745 [Clostridia bacterium]|nr:hypothetical protein [Clostridia bacterium]